LLNLILSILIEILITIINVINFVINIFNVGLLKVLIEMNGTYNAWKPFPLID